MGSELDRLASMDLKHGKLVSMIGEWSGDGPPQTCSRESRVACTCNGVDLDCAAARSAGSIGPCSRKTRFVSLVLRLHGCLKYENVACGTSARNMEFTAVLGMNWFTALFCTNKNVSLSRFFECECGTCWAFKYKVCAYCSRYINSWGL
jgi:hypothetical protein